MYWWKQLWLIVVLQEHGNWWRSGGREGRRAVLRRADLSGAVLSGADLSGAVLSDAVLSDADLSGAVISDAIFGPMPKVEDLHTKMLAAIDAGGTLDMYSWHGPEGACGTTHCRAGWAIHLAGEDGAKLEARVGPEMAGDLITRASCPWIKERPDFHASNAGALADIRMRAEEEAARKATASE